MLAVAGTQVLLSLAPAIPRLEEVAVNSRVLGFAVGAGLCTGVLFGLAPLAQLAPRSLGETLAGRFRGSSEGGTRIQSGAIAFQLALTVVLLVAGGLFARSLVATLAVDPGFEPGNLATLRVSVPGGRYPTQADASRFFQKVVRELEAVPGVESVAGSYGLPFPGGAPRNVLQIGAEGEGDRVGARRRTVLPRYHETMGIPLLAGRYLAEADQANQARAMVISESLARRYWRDESPLGRTVGFWGNQWTIVGIVGDVCHTALTSEGEPTFYVPFAQVPRRNLNLVARTTDDPAAVLPLLREAVWRIDPDMPLTEVSTLAALVRESTGESRYRTLLVVTLGVMASLLAVIGVFGVTARAVAHRTREMGIRMALGARHRKLVAQTLQRTLLLAAMGALLGLVAAGGTSRLLAHLLFGVGAGDPLTYATVVLLLLLACTFAALVPAMRVARLAPMEVLREE
jgi:predicted permease